MKLLQNINKEAYLKIESNSKLTDVKDEYLNEEYPIYLDGEFKPSFLNEFSKLFSNVIDLRYSAYSDGELNFIYKLSKLKKLDIHFFSDVKSIVNFEEISPLLNLGMNWYHKYIKKLDSQKELKHLSISDFTEKDFKRVPNFDNLKSFRSIGGKLRTLENIESIKNIQALEISAHRSLLDISAITSLKKLKFIEINSCWKMADFSPLAELKELEIVKIVDCKNLESIKFVKELPKLRQLYAMGTTTINDFDTTPAENTPCFFCSQNTNKYNKQYPEKEIIEGQKGWNYYAGD